jgi:excisionase family DNA binding protein
LSRTAHPHNDSTACSLWDIATDGFTMDNNLERWYSMKEIMEYLGVSRDTVLDWIERREMPAAKIGRLWKFKISEVDAWMKSGVAADK